MSNYKLEYNESIIKEADNIRYGDRGIYVNTLILTNLHLVLKLKGFLGNSKDTLVYDLKKIARVNDSPMIIYDSKGYSPQIRISFKDTSLVVGFINKKEALDWLEVITKVINDDVEGAINLVNKHNKFDKSVVSIVSSLKDQFEDVADILGMKKEKVQQVPSRKTIKCPSCGAQITGYEGKSVVCKYCDSTISL